MMMLGYAAQAADVSLAPFRFERREARPNDVVIDILYCGVCHTDLHMARNDWGMSLYPLVPGHEIIGRVVSVGREVTRFKAGDHVGVGCMVDSCQHCPACERGLEQYCEGQHSLTYSDRDRHDGRPTYGGYSERIVVSDKFVVRIPDGLDLAGAAPLLCAGITTWSPLRHWNVGKGEGRGHRARWPRSHGAEVRQRPRRRANPVHPLAGQGRRCAPSRRPPRGAVHRCRADATVKGRFDLIVDTVPYVHDLNPYLPTLALDGTLVLVGYLGGLEPALSTVPMLLGRRSVVGSAIGGINETQDMLDFCGEHGITCDIEMIRIQDVNAAYERLLKSDVKYRFVIDLASLRS